MFRRIVFLAGGLALLAASSSFAQEAVLSQEYGSGVHAFFTGDYVNAYQRLSSAIEKGSKDPRTFYFRGLACLQLGRRPDAVLDFQKGAELESKDVNKFYDVGKSLERVQGAARTELENYRVQARMAIYEEEQRLRKERYEAVRREESRVMRSQSTEPEATESNNPFAPDSGSAEPAEEPNPFAPDADDSQPKKGSKSAGKKKSAVSDDEDPFATEPEKSGDQADKPAKKDSKKKDDKKGKKETKPAEKKPDAEDPFGAEDKPSKDKKGEKAGGSKKSDDKKKGEKKDDKKDPFES
jgi:hypothetical protein